MKTAKSLSVGPMGQLGLPGDGTQLPGDFAARRQLRWKDMLARAAHARSGPKVRHELQIETVAGDLLGVPTISRGFGPRLHVFALSSNSSLASRPGFQKGSQKKASTWQTENSEVLSSGAPLRG